MDRIWVVCAADNDFAAPLAVTMRSSMVNLRHGTHLELIVIDGGIRKGNKEKIARSLENYPCGITFSTVDPTRLEGVRLTTDFPTVTHFRLLIPELVPASCSKVIYLDSDLVVRGDLGALWNLNLGDNHLLAAQDTGVLLLRDAPGLPEHRTPGTGNAPMYFNSGVLVIDVEKWRADRIGEQVIAYAQTNRKHVRWPDQDALNATLIGKWGPLDLRWNQLPSVHDEALWVDERFSYPQREQLVDDPHIVHYSQGKPWKFGCRHPQVDLYFHYLDQTAWSGWRPSKFGTRARLRKRRLVRAVDKARQVLRDLQRTPSGDRNDE
ncbi:MAG: glycosyltransferase family 8 protein [Gammaproteobacteria bacterium]|nr:glycosyltransferase family 8 protein [Gammaproteobacteria bacterium]